MAGKALYTHLVEYGCEIPALELAEAAYQRTRLVDPEPEGWFMVGDGWVRNRDQADGGRKQ
jgi:hypothetical protein